MIPENEIHWTLTCNPEHVQIKGNASAIDDETDSKIETWIKNQLRRGNTWAWCSVTLEASWRGLVVGDSLGCCSYKSEADFKAPGGYYDDMRAECLRQLNDAADDIVLALTGIQLERAP